MKNSILLITVTIALLIFSQTSNAQVGFAIAKNDGISVIKWQVSMAELTTEASIKATQLLEQKDRSLVGVWTYRGGRIEFNADGSGALKMKNRNPRADCAEGSVTNFKWRVDNERLHLNYTSMYICGEKQPTPESDDPKTYSISGNTLKWAGVSWTKQ